MFSPRRRHLAPPQPGVGQEAHYLVIAARLQVPTTTGAPAARTALRGNGFRFSNSVVAAAVKHRKSLSGTATEADDEKFEEAVVV
jgi:hypothetical protein